MMKINLYEVARFYSISPPHLSHVRSNKRGFSKKTALAIASLSGIPVEKLLLGDGGAIYQELVKAYTASTGGKQ